MSRETVRSATWKPSFSSSPWILGAPQRGLAAVIRVTRAAISGLTGGRPLWAGRRFLSNADGTGAAATAEKGREQRSQEAVATPPRPPPAPPRKNDQPSLASAR